MKRKETIQILSKIANSLDNYSLYKEATTVTKLMTKIAQSEGSEPESEGEDTLANYNARNPMPQEDRENYYQKLIKEYKQKLLSGEYTARQLQEHIYGNGSQSLQVQAVQKGYLTDAQVSAFKKQFGRILRELAFENVDQKFEMDPEKKPIFENASNVVHGLIDAYLRNRNLTVKNLNDTKIQDEIIDNLSKQLSKKYPGKSGYIKLLKTLVTGYSDFESKPNVGNSAPKGSTPQPGTGFGDKKKFDYSV